MESEGSLPCSQKPDQSEALCWQFVTWLIFYGEELLVPRPTPKSEDHPFSATRDCLFNIYTDPPYLEMIVSIHNLRTSPSAATGTHLTWIP
jgi:hypothetical protein